MKVNSQPDYLFAYGTLRKGFGLQMLKNISHNIDYVGSGAINGALYDIGEYPAALPTEDKNSKIAGEIYQLKHSRKMFRLLDEYEGYDRKDLQNSEYYRRRETLELDNGDKIKVWVYWYNFPVNDKMKIEDSDYLNYLKGKEENYAAL